MSSTITLNKPATRRTDALVHLLYHVLVISGLFLMFLVFVRSPESPGFKGLLSTFASASAPAQASSGEVSGKEPESALSPRMWGALEHVARRYKVSSEVLIPVFELAQLAAQERRIDPLLIVAIIGIESSFNPFAESSMGAQGLMQVIPRFHRDKVPDEAAGKSFFDPDVNILVGVKVLEEAIRRRGSLTAGLQYYAGSTDPEGLYSKRVLAEKERLENAARRSGVLKG